MGEGVAHNFPLQAVAEDVWEIISGVESKPTPRTI